MRKINFGMIKSTTQNPTVNPQNSKEAKAKTLTANKKSAPMDTTYNRTNHNEDSSSKPTFLESHAKQLGFSYVPFWLKEMHDNLKPTNLVFR